MHRSLSLVFALAFTLIASSARADKAAPLAALSNMPVKEITVFKDGHAFVLHTGRLPTDANGNVLMDYLPQPVLGTFWPYSVDKNVRLSAVTASQRKVLVERTAISLRDLIEANIGAAVTVTEMPVGAGRDPAPVIYGATIVSVPEISGEELEATSPPNSGEKLPQQGNIVLMRTEQGTTKVVQVERIVDIAFKGPHKAKAGHEEFRNLLTLKLEWPDGKKQNEAEVGMIYVQRGLRWIPDYRVTIDGKGNAAVKLQATLINELTDLEDVTANLVIGVPTFAFKDMVDPMALQQQAAQLSQYFREDAQTAYGFSNAIMSQQARMTEVRPVQPPPGGRPVDLGPEVGGSEKAEDLFIFSVKHITLKKGQRMVIPVAEYSLTYRDVYKLDIPFTPPPEIRRGFDNARNAELARLFNAPKVMHKLRLTNKGDYPLTTAPAMILKQDKVLAQGMMTYTAIGAETDLDLTTAVDVRVKKTDTESKRTPNATVWQGDTYGRIDLNGKIELTNYGKQPIEVEVVRNVLGNVTEADHDGKIEMVNVFEDASFAGGGTPTWWGWYPWPWWWHHFNGIGRVTWTVKLEPGKSAEMSYVWNYYWR